MAAPDLRDHPLRRRRRDRDDHAQPAGQLNAFTTQMMVDMIAAFDATDADDAVRAVIVTGAGRGFCAGADLVRRRRDLRPQRARQDPAREDGRVGGVVRDGGGRLTLRIFDSLKPVIAAVNGPAVGVGVTMQLAMDIRLASTEARYGFVFARRGLNAGGGLVLVPAAPGRRRRRRWSGATPAASSRRRRRTRRAWCARCTRRTSCCRPPAPWPARSSTTPRRSPSPHPPADLAHGRRRPSDGRAHGRQPRHPARGAQRDVREGVNVLPREAPAGLPGQGLRRPAGHLAAVERADSSVELAERNERLTPVWSHREGSV